MSRFLESICIQDGIPQHLSWHQRRMDQTRYAQGWMPVSLQKWFASIDIPQQGTYRCRIVYDAGIVSQQFIPRENTIVSSLEIVPIPPSYQYRYKYENREVIHQLFDSRKAADDILMTRNGWVLDTSVANIAFERKGRWYTPSLPLLAGTTWKRLVSEGVILPKPIHVDDISSFDRCRIFNVMNGWEREVEPVIEAPGISTPLISTPLISAPLISAPLISAPLISAPLDDRSRDARNRDDRS